MDNSLIELKQLSIELTVMLEQMSISNRFSVLDKDTLKQKCATVYEAILNLNTEIENTGSDRIHLAIPPEVYNSNELQIETIKEQPSILLENNAPSIDPLAEIINSNNTLFDHLADKTATEIQNEIIDEIVEQNQKEEEISKPGVLKEIIQELSLHEKIATTFQPKPDLSEKLIANLGSLKSAINVNLKIAIVNQLFKENTVEYVKSIDKLNASENINEAMRFFSELKHTYDWDNEDSLVKELESLIQKRFQ